MQLHKIGNSDIVNKRKWPPVNKFSECSKELSAFLMMSQEDIQNKLYNMRSNKVIHREVVMNVLNTIYSNYFGAKDAPCYSNSFDNITQTNFMKVKLELEDELIDYILSDTLEYKGALTTQDVVQYLVTFVQTNKGVLHPFFSFAEESMTKSQWREFLMIEVIRNEVVDDEVAMMIPGLQHSLKQVMSSNLWDECGNGNIDGFHTTWLRRLLDYEDLWEELYEYRKTKPWFTSLTSNSLNSLLTAPNKTYAAYGHFLITEGWVCPHFEKMLRGLKRVGLDSEDTLIYFKKHIALDPQHTKEMLEGVLTMSPELNENFLKDIVCGAHQAAAAGSLMYDSLLKYFKG